MARGNSGLWLLASLVLVGILGFAGCSPAAAPAPTAAPAKPAVAPTAAPAAPAPTTAPAVAPAPTTAAPAAPAKAAVLLRAGCGFAKGDVYCAGIDKWAELVQQKSNGEISVNVSYQVLGSEQQLAGAVMSGSVDIGNMSNGNAARYTNAYYLYDLPFLFKDNDAMLKWKLGSQGKAIDDKYGKDLGVKTVMSASQGGGRDIQTTKKQLKVPADIKGLKIRVVSTPIDLATFKAWGANPTPVDGAQTISALQQGVVEGLGGAAVFMLTSKWYEPVKYGVHIEYQQMFQQVFMNQKKFDSLTAAQQKTLLDTAQEAELWQHQYSRDLAKTAIQELGKLGLTYYEPTADEWKQWASIRETVWNDVADQLKDKIDIAQARQIYASQQ